MADIFGNNIIHRHKINYQHYGLNKTPKTPNPPKDITPPDLSSLDKQREEFFNDSENRISQQDFDIAKELEERYSSLLRNPDIKRAIVDAANREWEALIKGYNYSLANGLYPMLRNNNVRELYLIRQKIKEKSNKALKDACRKINRSTDKRLAEARETSKILLEILNNISQKKGYTEQDIKSLNNLFDIYNTSLKDIEEKLKIGTNLKNGGRKRGALKEIDDILDMLTVMPNVSGRQGEIGEVLSSIADDEICDDLQDAVNATQEELIDTIQDLIKEQKLGKDKQGKDSIKFQGDKQIKQQQSKKTKSKEKKTYTDGNTTIEANSSGESYRRKTDVIIKYNGEKTNLSVKNLKDFDREVTLVSNTPFDRILSSIDSTGTFASHYANLRVIDSGTKKQQRTSYADIDYKKYKAITDGIVNAQIIKVALKGYVKEDYTKFLVVFSKGNVKVIPINAILQYYKDSQQSFSATKGVQRIMSKKYENKGYEEFTEYVNDLFNKKKITVHIKKLSDFYNNVQEYGKNS